uniref:RING-type domain-containing protein n=1 Tax=Oryza punctata TaxID=4537 RepID=A0A0E0MCD4_ORYPU
MQVAWKQCEQGILAHSASAFPRLACDRLLQPGHGLARRGDSAKPTVPVRILLLHYSIHGSATALTLQMIAKLITKRLQEVGVQFYAPPTNVRSHVLANDLMSFFLHALPDRFGGQNDGPDAWWSNLRVRMSQDHLLRHEARRRAATSEDGENSHDGVFGCGDRTSAKAMVTLHQPNLGETREQDCAVCLEPFEEGNTLRMMPCFHSFHQRCIFSWLRISRICPVCRFTLPSQADFESEKAEKARASTQRIRVPSPRLRSPPAARPWPCSTRGQRQTHRSVRILLLHHSIHGSATALTLQMIAKLITKRLQEVGVQFYAPPTNVRSHVLANDLMSFFLR